MQNKKYFYQGLTVIISVSIVVLGWVYFVYGTSIGTDIQTVNLLATGTTTLATTTIGTNFYIDEDGNASTTGYFFLADASTTGTFIVGGASTLTGAVTMSGSVLVVGTTTLATTTIGTNFYIDEVGNASTTGYLFLADASTTGTLIVGGASTLTGDVTMSGNALVVGTTTLATTTIGTNFYIDEVGNASTTGDFFLADASTTGTMTIGSGTAINKIMFGTVVIDPDPIATSTTGIASSTVTGLTTDMTCFVNPPDILSDDLIPKGATTTAADKLGVYLYNPDQTTDGAAIDDGAYTWGYICIK